MPLRYHQRPGFWAGMMFAAFGAIAGLSMSDAIDATTGLILMVLASGLIWPLVRSALISQRHAGQLSPAIARYTRRFMLAVLGYILGLGIAVTIADSIELASSSAFLMAMLPVLPIMAMIWAMWRYLMEEDDEYLRYRAMISSLAGLGVILAAGSFWGFLEPFGVVPHVASWWIFPAWAVAMGAAQSWISFRNRTEVA